MLLHLVEGDADGRDIGEWDPTTYKNLGEDLFRDKLSNTWMLLIGSNILGGIVEDIVP